MPQYTIDQEVSRTKGSSDLKHYIEEVAFFSDRAGIVTLDKNQLHSYRIFPPNTRSFANPYGWNTKLGYKNYTPKVFKSNESTIENFSKCLIQLSEKKESSIDLPSYKIFCPSSFFQYISVKKQSEFHVIWYNNRYIIANKETREGQNVLMSYSGIRFEDLLTRGTAYKTVHNRCLYESVIETKVNGQKCLYYAEIDSFDPESGKYTEIKMILCKSNIPHAKTKDKRLILTSLSKGNAYFDVFLFRLLIQCKFSNMTNVVIGVRDQSFTIRNINEFSVEEDLLSFFAHTYPECFQRYLSSLELVSRVTRAITKGVNEENPVFSLEIGAQYTLKSIDAISERQKIIDRIIIPEFKILLDSFD